MENMPVLISVEQKVEYILRFLLQSSPSYLIILDRQDTHETEDLLHGAVQQANKTCPVLPLEHAIGHTRSKAFFVQNHTCVKIVVIVPRIEGWLGEMIHEWNARVVTFNSLRFKEDPYW